MAGFNTNEWNWLPNTNIFGGSSQDVSGVAPVDDTMAQLQLKRRLAQADALKNAQMPEGQMVSGHYVAPAWTQRIENMYGKYKGGQEEQQAMQDYGNYQATKQQKYADLLSETDPIKFQQGLAQMPEYAPELVKARLQAMNKEDTGQIIPAGATFYKGGKAVYTAPTKPEHTALSDIGKLTSELQDIQAANPNDPRIPAYQDAIKKASTFAPPMQVVSLPAPQVAINPRTNQPELVQFPNKPGMAPQFTGIQPYEKPKDLTEAQSNANLFGTRADKANKELNALAGQYSPAKVQLQNFTGGVPGASYLANKFMSDKDQQASQAQMDFVTAVLRKESGASISQSEFENARRQYFPQPGDSAAVIAQKAKNRQTAVNGIMGSAGAANKPSGKVVVDY